MEFIGECNPFHSNGNKCRLIELHHRPNKAIPILHDPDPVKAKPNWLLNSLLYQKDFLVRKQKNHFPRGQ